MPNRSLLRPAALAAMGALSASLGTGTAWAAEYATVNLSIPVDRPADVVWKKVGGYCDISAWLKMTCVMTAGNGELGSIRRLNDRIDEVMVAQTAYSYTYTQPTSTILYHGTLEVVPEGKNKSTIHYSLFWDQAPLADAAAKTQDKERRKKLFTDALDAMKKLAEAEK
jgi:hypothetical protein